MRVDVDRYRDRAAPVDLAGIDFDAFRDRPLPSGAIRCLRYMHDIEHHTVCYLRDLLVTPAHRDPDITTFLTVWSYEEMWHGLALGRVLAAHDEPHGAGRVSELRRRLGVRDRLSPLLHTVGSTLAGDTFPAVHMAWGAVNEWTTQAGYARLIDRARHPVLTDLLSRIMRQEGRHIAFYAAEAERRLSGSRRAQRLCRAALRRLWRPVGAGVMPRSEVAFMVRELFGDDGGRAIAQRIDHRVDTLPGLGGLRLVERAVDHYTTGTTGTPGPAPSTPARLAA
ncbi:MAG: ferritin-like domain-containing protein [Acidimicrobiales bacterium]